MSKGQELKKSVIAENENIAKDIEIASALSDQIPEMIERKKEAEVKLKFIESLPEDILEEIAPNLLYSQKFDEQRFSNSPLSGVTMAMANDSPYYDTTGTSTAYEKIASEINQHYQLEPSVIASYDELAEEKSRKADLPIKLNTLNIDLGKMFIEIEKNYRKCLAGVMNVSQVANDFRSFLQQVWGGLVALARKRYHRNLNRIQSPQFKKETHRALIAENIAKQVYYSDQLKIVLNDMYDLYFNCSSSKFSKSILSDDFEGLKEIWRKLILQITDLIGMVNLE